MPKPYSLQKRDSAYYVQFWNPQANRYTTARSTLSKDRDKALILAEEWLRNGLPKNTKPKKTHAQEILDTDTLIAAITSLDLTQADGLRIVKTLKNLGLIDSFTIRNKTNSESFISFLTRFWKYEESPYIREKLAYGQCIGKRHSADMAYRVNSHWKPFFGETALADISKKTLKDFSLFLADKKLAASTINKTLIAGTTALGWAFKNDLIAVDPTIGLMHFSGKAMKRGILEPEEVKALFLLEWPDLRAYAANVVAAITGLRMGEILALQIQDIGNDRLFVRHSWSDKDGLKLPKNGDEREVPLLPEVRDILLQVVASSPYDGSADSFIFYGRYARRPLDAKPIGYAFKQALIQLSLGDKKPNQEAKKAAATAWASRGIVFHSWRHWYAKMMTDHADAVQVQRLTGHRDRLVLEHYADHQHKADYIAMGDVVHEVFADLFTPKAKTTVKQRAS